MCMTRSKSRTAHRRKTDEKRLVKNSSLHEFLFRLKHF
ncbi:hypothetical protein T4B_8758 [Trichinella pseudospiralis]|uniref:Uncharacterized protein n=1 Tax=Trichinella pseudospiralis TaxID=6337 RepID=A0A0V1GDN3_TRIPS|nr:hypothetical protein T4B_8758 [Trichinella pseudospiralis]